MNDFVEEQTLTDGLGTESGADDFVHLQACTEEESGARDFVHLHVHTEYSLLDGACDIEKLLDRAGELGMKSLAITDHGVMYGVIDFFTAAAERGIKPIIGCEVYTAPRTRFDKEGGRDNGYGHLVLLAENNEGYENLMYIVSMGFVEGFYYKPRVDLELLAAHSKGIIALSACLAGDIPHAFLNDDEEKAKEYLLKYQKIFGKENFYIELQDHGLAEQKRVNPKLIALAKETGTPMVVTNDAHYINKADAHNQDVLMCIQMGKTVDDENRMKFETDEFYLKSPSEMRSLFPAIAEAAQNTVKIAQRCNVSFEFDKLQLPRFDVPEGKEPFGYLQELCYEGLKKRYGENADSSIREKLDYELSVISSMGYVDYFLIVWDFIHYARSKGIMVGPGRGSAAGSLVAYCLTITSIDPIKYNLLFERFLNPERISMPDIDIDFCYERRQEVIDYVISKYGADKVCQIITFGTMAAKAAVRDVGRALGMAYAEVDRVAKMIPFELKMTISKALDMNKELKDLYSADARVRELIDTAQALEGLPRHASTHAAGVVITKEPVYRQVPVQKNDDVVTTQFPMGILEKLGVLKMDFLGLRTLTVIRDTVEMAKRNGKSINIDEIDYNEEKVYQMISAGDTVGVFQLESGGMTQFMRELAPENLEDIIAGISLYRPGPMEQIPRYIENKKNPDKVQYKHPLLENILDVTYGCMVYQEQVMQIVRSLAGYSLGRADLVRRAMSKKKTDVMEKERKNFIYGYEENGEIVVPGAIRMGVPEDVAGSIFDEMMDFAKYAFNKSHAAAYAVVAYQTAYLKCFYPTEFMAALLTSVLGNTAKVSGYIAECKRLGISLLPPDVNKSFDYFNVEDASIRFCMASVKNVGKTIIHSAIGERESDGDFKGLKDFCTRMRKFDLNKRALEGLIKCGAFDFTGASRSQLLKCYETVLGEVAASDKKNVEGQISLFGGGFGGEEEAETYPPAPDLDYKEILNMEKEATGLYLSGHPLDEYKDKIAATSSTTIEKILESGAMFTESGRYGAVADGEVVTVGGIITAKKDKITKSNAFMSFLSFEDLTGGLEVIVFPKVLQEAGGLVAEDGVVTLRARVSIKEEEDAKLVAIGFSPLETNKGGKTLTVTVNDPSDLDRLHPVVMAHRGGDRLELLVGEKRVEARPCCYVQISPALIGEVEQIMGEGSTMVV